MFNYLKSVVERTDTLPGRVFDLLIQALIIISLISFSLETLPDLSPQARSILRLLEIAIVIFFTMEYLLRIFVADRRLKYIFSFYGIIDLLAILPFYLALAVDLRSLRIFRVFRLFRIFKLTRYNRALVRIAKAILLAKEELILFSIVTAVLLYVSAIGIYYFEHNVPNTQYKSLFDSLWWAVASLTTVGYGDIYPTTMGGKVFTFFVLMIGLGVVSVPTGIVASALSAVRCDEKESEQSAPGVQQDSTTANPTGS